MEQHGNKTTYNIETVLRKNIVDSEYWRNTCAKLQSWEEVVDQIYYDVDHVEPWMSGNARGASSAFGLLYRLCQLVPTDDEVDAMLRHKDSPYIRAVRLAALDTISLARVLMSLMLQVGFLYLRYVGEPRGLWAWLRNHVQDREEIHPSGEENGSAVTIGEYVRDVFLEQYYFETIFPRIPKPVHDEWLASLRGMGLPAKAVGNGGQGGADRRGLDEPNRRPASVKASLSVAFGQRAPNRATAREEGRGLGAGMKNVFSGTRSEERPRSSSKDKRTNRDHRPNDSAAQQSRDGRERNAEQYRSSRHDRDGTSAREPQQPDRSRGRSEDRHSYRDSGHERSHREESRHDRHHSRHRSRSPYDKGRANGSRHVSNGSHGGLNARHDKLKAAYGSSPSREEARHESSKPGAEEVYHTGSYRSRR